VKLIKRLLKILVALVLLVVLAAVALVFVFDPNVFKPRIESLAKEQGVHLNIDGNLGWQLWPALGVEVNGIRVAAESAPDDEIARLEKASLRLAIRPLLRGEVVIHHIAVDGAALDLRVDENGVGNWEALLPDDETPEPEPVAEAEATEGEALSLAVERISLSNAALRYRDAGTGQDLELSPLNLTISEFNLQGRPFNLDLGVVASVTDRELLGDQPLLVEATLSSRFTLAEDFDSLQLDDGRLRLDLERGGASDDIRLTLSAQASNLMTEPQFQGELALRPFNPRELMAVLSLPAPEMADSGALTRLALTMTFSGDTSQIGIDPLQIELDDTRIDGRFAVTDFERGALRASLRGNRINIDHYLPPPSDEDVEEPEATGDEELIPLELVRDLDLEFLLVFDALTVMDLAMQNLDIRLVAGDGVVELKQAQLQLYEGQVDAGGKLDATGDTARIDLRAQLSGLQIGPLLSDLEFDEHIQLSGAVNFDTQGKTRGTTMNQLMAALDAEANFSGAQVRMAPLNIEEKFCQVVDLVTRSERGDRDWPEYTELSSLSGRAVIKDQVITIDSTEAGVGQLALQVRGSANMKEDSYDFTLPLRLRGQRTSEAGCRMTSDYWVDRDLSLLRCRGSIEGLNPVSDCRPDTRALERLVRDFAEYRVREQHGDRIDAERDRAQQRAREERERADERVEEEKRRLQERVRERVGGDDDESTEDRVRNLFRR